VHFGAYLTPPWSWSWLFDPKIWCVYPCPKSISPVVQVI